MSVNLYLFFIIIHVQTHLKLISRYNPIDFFSSDYIHETLLISSVGDLKFYMVSISFASS